MRKNCETCKHDDAEYPSYPHKTPCNECLLGNGYNDAPTKWEAADHYMPDTNADRIRSMSDEDLAKYLLDAEQGNFTIDCCNDKFCDTQNCCNDCTDAAIKWLKQPADNKCVPDGDGK